MRWQGIRALLNRLKPIRTCCRVAVFFFSRHNTEAEQNMVAEINHDPMAMQGIVQPLQAIARGPTAHLVAAAAETKRNGRL